MPDAIVATGLTRDFGPVRAVDGLTLRVPAGVVYGFLGPNGAGKTTTLHMLLGILEPTSGRAEVAGIDVASRPGEARRRCGALLEFNGLYERLTARENLGFHARAHGLPKAERDARIEHALRRIGLWERRDDRVGTWSRGMKQQLAIARATLHNPAVLFLDEPTAGFDPAAAARLRKDVRDIAQAGTTVFLTTHNLHEAEEVCDRVAVLQNGRLVAEGPPATLRAGPQRITITGRGFTAPLVARLRKRKEVAACRAAGGRLEIELASEAPDAPAAPLVRLLVEGGASVEEVVRPRASLEAAFLAILGDAA